MLTKTNSILKNSKVCLEERNESNDSNDVMKYFSSRQATVIEKSNATLTEKPSPNLFATMSGGESSSGSNSEYSR